MNVFEDSVKKKKKKKKALVLLVCTEAGANVLSSAGRASDFVVRARASAS